MKEADSRRVIVTPGVAAGGAEAHHQDFPEIRAQGGTPADAACHLAHQLSRALDSALTHWRRESIENAILDVEAYAKGNASAS